MKRQLKKFGELLETKYKGYDINGHRGVAEGRYEGFSAASAKREPVSGVNPNLKDLALPFKKFCEINGVELIPGSDPSLPSDMDILTRSPQLTFSNIWTSRPA